jgi:toxin YoeB
MREIAFTPSALAEFNLWRKKDKKIRTKIIQLLKETAKEPFKGIGKPEPLKHQYKGCWSRRVNKEHRLVYQVLDDSIVVISCMFHY